MKLIKYEGNWADEMDLSGFMIMSESEWKNYLANWEKALDITPDFLWGIGTNEEVEFDSFDSFSKSFNVKEITNEEAELLEHLFLNEAYGVYGFFPYTDILAYVE